jgi:hypothetical protein
MSAWMAAIRSLLHFAPDGTPLPAPPGLRKSSRARNSGAMLLPPPPGARGPELQPVPAPPRSREASQVDPSSATSFAESPARVTGAGPPGPGTHHAASKPPHAPVHPTGAVRLRGTRCYLPPSFAKIDKIRIIMTPFVRAGLRW